MTKIKLPLCEWRVNECMKKEFNLSEEAIEAHLPCPDGRMNCLVYHFTRHYPEEKVKEFIRLLKEAFPINCIENHKFNNKINDLAGDALK